MMFSILFFVKKNHFSKFHPQKEKLKQTENKIFALFTVFLEELKVEEELNKV